MVPTLLFEDLYLGDYIQKEICICINKKGGYNQGADDWLEAYIRESLVYHKIS